MITACPSRARWREWLDDKVSSDERTEMSVHLEGCQHCQRLCDDLGGDERGWADAVNAGTVAPPDNECIRAMNDLKARPPVFQQAPADLLSPNDPGSLKNVDGYEITGEIGRGGMGVVLKGFDPKLRRVVAIKVLAPHLAANAAARERFIREARAAAAVAHEHVVTIHAVEESPSGTPYLVMQYVGGRSLQERLDQSGPLELKEILRIGMQTAAGLAAAHKQGLVHRDVKPANILLENGVERVKLADFGLARAADDASLTRSGVVTGSPLFMSPEQARGETADHRSDLFGLGCVMYAMCAGHPPFRASSPLAVLKRVCDDAPRSLREVNPDVPDWLEAIVFKLLAKEPEERFESAAEVSELLGQHLRYMQQPDASAPPKVEIPASALPAGREAAPQRARRAAPKKSGNWIILSLLISVAGAILCCTGVPILGFLFYGASADFAPPVAEVRHEVSGAPVLVGGTKPLAPNVTRPKQPPRPVIEALTDPKGEELATMRQYSTIETAKYDPKTQTVAWTGKTTQVYGEKSSVESIMQFAVCPISFFSKEGREIKSQAIQLEVGKRDAEGHHLLFFQLKLSDEILKNAETFEMGRR